MTLTPAICQACVRSWRCLPAWPWLRTSFWQAKVARDAVRIDWDEGEMHAFSTSQMMQQFREQPSRRAPSMRRDGKPDAALAKAAQKIEAVYEVPYLSHLMMEPLNCAVDLREDSCEIWTGTQFQSRSHRSLSRRSTAQFRGSIIRWDR